jgi:phosphoribosylformimino-5-aminoimidazole carboxamide ribotide isomerase
MEGKGIMKIIPVLDLMKGVVVHAIKGERENYQPVQSILTSSPDPLEVARVLKKETNCHEFYIADLDAIQDKGHNRDEIGKIADHLDVDLWVDAGIGDVKSAQSLVAAGADVVIIGSETLTSLEELRHFAESMTCEQVIFSLDMAGGRVLSCAKALKGMEPLEALELLTAEGIERFILLTLDVVGSGNGPDRSLFTQAKHNFPGHTFVAGGGVKTRDQLQSLSDIGTSSVLVATSLHNGWITGGDIASLK